MFHRPSFLLIAHQSLFLEQPCRHSYSRSSWERSQVSQVYTTSLKRHLSAGGASASILYRRRVSSMSIAHACRAIILTSSIGSQMTALQHRRHCKPSRSDSKPRTCSTSQTPTAQRTGSSPQGSPRRRCSPQRPPQRTFWRARRATRSTTSSRSSAMPASARPRRSHRALRH